MRGLSTAGSGCLRSSVVCRVSAYYGLHPGPGPVQTAGWVGLGPGAGGSGSGSRFGPVGLGAGPDRSSLGPGLGPVVTYNSFRQIDYGFPQSHSKIPIYTTTLRWTMISSRRPSWLLSLPGFQLNIPLKTTKSENLENQIVLL